MGGSFAGSGGPQFPLLREPYWLLLPNRDTGTRRLRWPRVAAAPTRTVRAVRHLRRMGAHAVGIAAAARALVGAVRPDRDAWLGAVARLVHCSRRDCFSTRKQLRRPRRARRTDSCNSKRRHRRLQSTWRNLIHLNPGFKASQALVAELQWEREGDRTYTNSVYRTLIRDQGRRVTLVGGPSAR